MSRTIISLEIALWIAIAALVGGFVGAYRLWDRRSRRPFMFWLLAGIAAIAGSALLLYAASLFFDMVANIAHASFTWAGQKVVAVHDAIVPWR